MPDSLDKLISDLYAPGGIQNVWRVSVEPVKGGYWVAKLRVNGTAISSRHTVTKQAAEIQGARMLDDAERGRGPYAGFS